MRTVRTLIVVTAGSIALAACQTSEPSVATCYGIAPSGGGMDQCAVVRSTNVTQYQTSRAASEGQLAAEVRNVCLSYGLQPGSQIYANCLVREADNRRGASYAGHFARPGERYDQQGRLVDSQGYLVDRDGRRIGGRGYWVSGPGETVPPGTVVGASTAQQITAATAQQITAAPPRSYASERRSYPFSNSTALGF